MMSATTNKQLLATGVVCIGILVSGCAATDPEPNAYPATWPALLASVDDCSMPFGTFSNFASYSHFEYPDLHPRINLTLTGALAAGPTGSIATHIAFDKNENGELVVRQYGFQADEEVLLDEFSINPDNIDCEDNRFTVYTSTTHENFSSYESDSYNPLYTAAYAVGTLGIGAPISKWWKYRFALDRDGSLIVRRIRMESGLLFLIYTRTAMDDDWFLFKPADKEQLKAQIKTKSFPLPEPM